MSPEKKPSYVRDSTMPPPASLSEDENWWTVNHEIALLPETADAYIAIHNRYANLSDAIASGFEYDPRLIFNKRLGGHSKRTPILAGLMHDYFNLKGITICDRDTLLESAFLHDLGKLREDINKLIKIRGALSKEQWEIMRQHPDEGSIMYNKLKAKINPLFNIDFPDSVTKTIKEHHEREDGNGYYEIPPRRLGVESRIVTLCDSTDAMLSPREYDPVRNKDEVKAELLRCADLPWDKKLTLKQVPEKQFNPILAKAMAEIIDKYRDFIFRFRDTNLD